MNQRGFSLIEMLVVMALFLTLMLVVSDIFLSVSLTQRKILTGQRAMNDLQYNVEQIVQQTRMNKIDYDYYNDQITHPIDKLALINENDETVLIYKYDEGCAPEVLSCILQKVGNDDAFVLSSNNIEIEKLDFYILPKESPYQFDELQGEYKSDNQPQVIIVVQGKTLALHEEDVKTINLQTTVSSRYYER
ncbi:prepilin-type N-terminal cleavage/methylation domain-containing protein [Candidatus Kuenenbacteria bacterium]|nr:prepilin-type N-terminal cleavage/methylation domain-containing protein [Candidatus Kuenenbacteria bacterium]